MTSVTARTNIPREQWETPDIREHCKRDLNEKLAIEAVRDGFVLAEVPRITATPDDISGGVIVVTATAMVRCPGEAIDDTELREFLDRSPEVLRKFLEREARRDPRWLDSFLHDQARVRGQRYP